MTDQINHSETVLGSALASLGQFTNSNANNQLFSESIQKAANSLEKKQHKRVAK